MTRVAIDIRGSGHHLLRRGGGRSDLADGLAATRVLDSRWSTYPLLLAPPSLSALPFTAAVSAVLSTFVRHRAVVLTACWTLEALLAGSYEARRTFLTDPECAGYPRTSRVARAGADGDAAAAVTGSGASAGTAVTPTSTAGAAAALAPTTSTTTAATTISATARAGQVSRRDRVSPAVLVAAAPSVGGSNEQQPRDAAAAGAMASTPAAAASPGAGGGRRDGRDLLHDVQVVYSLALAEAHRLAVTAAHAAAARRAARQVAADAAATTVPADTVQAQARAATTDSRNSTHIHSAADHSQAAGASRNSAAAGDDDDDSGSGGLPPSQLPPAEPDGPIVSASAAIHQLVAMVGTPSTCAPCVRLCVTGAGLPPRYIAFLARRREADRVQAWRRGGSRVKVVPLPTSRDDGLPHAGAAKDGGSGGGDAAASSESVAGGGSEEEVPAAAGGTAATTGGVYRGRRRGSATAGVAAGKRLVVFDYAPTSGEAREVVAPP